MNKSSRLDEDLEEVVFKFILVGDTGVGKSSILLKYTEQKFTSEHNVTVGVDFRSKVFKFEDRALIKLQIWDTAGQETFGSIVRSFYRDAAAIFLVYDVKVRESFKAVENWLDEVRINCDSDPIYILIGNQADSETEREVPYEEGVEFMKLNDISYFFETSAQNGTNIELAFQEAAQLAYLKYARDKMGQSKEKASLNLKDSRPGERLTLGKARVEQKQSSGGGCC